MIAYPYGYRSDTKAGHCVNAEPGTFNHECGRPADNIGVKDNGFRAMFCDKCREHGTEAKAYKRWTKLASV